MYQAERFFIFAHFINNGLGVTQNSVQKPNQTKNLRKPPQKNPTTMTYSSDPSTTDTFVAFGWELCI